MRHALLGALSIITALTATGCSIRDEGAYLEAAFERGTTAEQQQADDVWLLAGEIACGRMKEGVEEPPMGTQQLTGISWWTVWGPAKEHLC